LVPDRRSRRKIKKTPAAQRSDPPTTPSPEPPVPDLIPNHRSPFAVHDSIRRITDHDAISRPPAL
jgi:hypothetical protein